MDWTVYNSNNQDALLKSNGPCRLTTTDNSLKGIPQLGNSHTTSLVVVGQIRVYGLSPTNGEREKTPDSESDTPEQFP